MTTSVSASEERQIRVAPGRVLTASSVLDTYWRFAYKRQELFRARIDRSLPPWTDDPVLAQHRFTNVYRAADRVSQHLIRNVIYAGVQTTSEVFFRTLLFKLFNKIETWEELTRNFATPEWRTFEYEAYASVLDAAMDRGSRLYSAAYIMPSPPFGSRRKHRNHLSLLVHMMRDGAPEKIERAHSLEDVFDVLREYPSLGPFLAFQFAIDLNYSALLNFSEMDFVVAGPGARDGIAKCFVDTNGFSDSDIIRAVTELADSEFDRLNLNFHTLWGRPLQLIDCQNLFCEVGKYARVVHPSVEGSTGRTRIKQRFVPHAASLPQWYPPKWRLELPEDLSNGSAHEDRGGPAQNRLSFSGIAKST